MINDNIQAMFRGYYEIQNNKQMIGSMDKKPPLLLSEVQELPSYAGRLNDDMIMVDFDDRDESNAMWQYVQDEDIQCNVIETTRGKHFYFKMDDDLMDTMKSSNDKLTPLGFHVDYKLGNKSAYSPLKMKVITGKF